MKGQFKLSSSFQSTFNSDKSATKDNKQKPVSVQQTFKLNPKSGNAIDGLSVDELRKNSKKKLQSLKDPYSGEKNWSIFDSKVQNKAELKAEKSVGKSYDFSLDRRRKSKTSSADLKAQQQKPKQQLPYDVVRPSKLVKDRKLENKVSNSIDQNIPTIFQTPLLPCFSSEFTKAGTMSENKKIAEKQGIWKIGKIKFSKRNNQISKGILTINGIEFQVNMADAQGKAGAVRGTNLYMVQNWKGFCVVEPKQQLFLRQGQMDIEN